MIDTMEWQEAGGHPGATTLLLFLEDDLDPGVRTVLAGHIKDCWVCRAECERLNRGMCNFVEYWEDARRQPSTRPLRRHEFNSRLREAASAHGFGWQRLAQLFRVPVNQQIACPSTAILILLLASTVAILLWRPPEVNAMELLNRARGFRKSVTLGKRAPFHQKILIRQGDHVAERDLYIESIKPRVSSYPVDVFIENSLLQADIDSNDPLNPSGFAAWRDSQTKRSEVITESPASYAITTRSLDEGVVESATLTMARSDWRPISERVTFRDRPPLEITEVAYEPGMAPPAPEVPSTLGRGTTVTPIGPPPAAQMTDEDLDDAEIQLREIFHRLNVDRNEAPRIWRTGYTIHYEGFFETEERKQQVIDAVRGIPFVSTAVSGGGAAAFVENENPRLFTSNPPLAKALWSYFGGLALANEYLARVRDAYLRSLPDGSALQRLAERYQGQRWESLSTRSQERLDRIAGDYLFAVRANSSAYLGLVSPVLDEFSNQSGRPNVLTEAASNECSSWRSEAPVIFSQLRKLHTSFQALFVIEQSDTPMDLSVENLLREASDARTLVQVELNRVCQP